MGIAHGSPRVVCGATETTFNTAVTMSSAGKKFYCVNPDTSNVFRERIDNENYRRGVVRQHGQVLGRKSVGDISFSQYLTATGTNAAEGAQATGTELTENLKCALGGEILNYGAGCSSAAAAVLSVDTGQGTNLTEGQLLPVEINGVTEWYVVQSISTDDVTVDRNLHDTVDASDRVYASVECFPHQAALTQPAHASHITRAFLFDGDDTEDLIEVRGVKLGATFEAFTQGTLPLVNFSGMVTSYVDDDSAQSIPSGSFEGEAPLAIGNGNATRILVGDKGGTMTDVDCFSAQVNVGITPAKVEGPNGDEGVHGYVAEGFDGMSLSMSFEYSGDWLDDMEAGTEKQMLIQIGTGSTSVALYFPRLEITRATRGTGPAGIVASMVELNMLENDASVGSLTGDDAERHYAPMRIGVCA